MRLIVCETGEQAVWVWVLRAALVFDGSACGGGGCGEYGINLPYFSVAVYLPNL